MPFETFRLCAGSLGLPYQQHTNSSRTQSEECYSHPAKGKSKPAPFTKCRCMIGMRHREFSHLAATGLIAVWEHRWQYLASVAVTFSRSSDRQHFLCFPLHVCAQPGRAPAAAVGGGG